MEARMLEIKAALSAFFALAGTFLGWKGILLVVWVAAMIMDYISGSLAAHKNGEWNSARAREGLFHKGGMILAVLVAMMFDACLAIVAITLPVLHMTWPGIIYPLVLAWYIITELGSILENSIAMGAACPSWLARGLKITADNLAKAGEDTVSQLEDDTK